MVPYFIYLQRWSHDNWTVSGESSVHSGIGGGCPLGDAASGIFATNHEPSGNTTRLTRHATKKEDEAKKQARRLSMIAISVLGSPSFDFFLLTSPSLSSSAFSQHARTHRHPHPLSPRAIRYLYSEAQPLAWHPPQ